MEQLYGIYAYVRVGSGLPEILLMKMDGDWTRSLEAAGCWGSREAVEAVLSKTVSRPDNSLNVWWFTWSQAVIDELERTAPKVRT